MVTLPLSMKELLRQWEIQLEKVFSDEEYWGATQAFCCLNLLAGRKSILVVVQNLAGQSPSEIAGGTDNLWEWLEDTKPMALDSFSANEHDSALFVFRLGHDPVIEYEAFLFVAPL